MAYNKERSRLKRKKRIRKRVTGTTSAPRLSLFRSAKHVYAQVIDDSTGMTLVALGSSRKGSEARASIPVCSQLGKSLAEKCLEKKIEKVVFDRNGFVYHGRVKAFAEGAREGGLKF